MWGASRFRNAYTRRLPISHWHAFHPGLAANLNPLGSDESVIQRSLRHSTVVFTYFAL